MPYDEHLEIETLERPSAKQFRDHFLDKQRPVKISGAIDHWPAIRDKKWSLDFFEARYGHEVVGIERFEPGERGRGKNSPQDYVKFLKFQDMKVADLIRVLKDKPDHMYYMAQHPFRKRFKGLREDIGENPYLKDCIEYIPGAHMDSYLWIGPKGTLTPFHQDPMPNFLTQVVGRKLAYLVPAEQTEKNLYIGQFERPSFSPVDVENPDLENYPNYRDCTLYKTIIHPGEMLHIPRNWGHAVSSLDAAISLSSFFITYRQLFMLLPEYVAEMMKRARNGWRWQQANERAGVNPPPRSADRGPGSNNVKTTS
jgi:[protein]-arginine 3-hydroxylase / protease